MIKTVERLASCTVFAEQFKAMSMMTKDDTSPERRALSRYPDQQQAVHRVIDSVVAQITEMVGCSDFHQKNMVLVTQPRISVEKTVHLEVEHTASYTRDLEKFRKLLSTVNASRIQYSLAIHNAQHPQTANEDSGSTP
jgi:hypothetical protein